MSRFASIPLETSTNAAEKARLGDRFVTGMQRTFAFGANGYFLAVYLRSVDLIAWLAQRALRLFGLHRAEYLIWEFRVGWRQWFEHKVCAISHARVLSSIDVVLAFYRDMGYLLPASPEKILYSRLAGSLAQDKVFTVEMAELQKLPVGRTALQRRILALDSAVERHISALAHDVVVGHMALKGVAPGGVR